MELARTLRDITKADAVGSYAELCAAVSHEFTGSRIGLNALDFFFLGHRLKAKTRRHISFYDAMHDAEIIAKLRQLVVQYKKKPLASYDARGLLAAQYQVFQLYYGTINQFRPMVAKWVYHLLKPSVGILDFSAGWGGRCIAAMSMGIPYIGIDANTKLESAYSRMIQTYDPHAAVQMIFRPSEQVDFSRFRYDLVFTSPPYFMIEEYERMPAYGSKEAFLKLFFVPVVLAAWAHLLPGGNMALNMPAEMYDALDGLLPKVKRQLEMPLSNRHPANAAKGTRLGATNKERHELIYVWHKQR